MPIARAGFSYESDIAPMRGDNFSVQDQLDREENAVKIAQINQAADNQKRTGDLEFERAKLALESARRETQQQNDANRLYPEISQRISGIMNDATKDPATRLMEIETTRQQYGTTVVQNPALNNLFNSAQTIVTVKNDQDKQRDALALDFVQRGDVEAIKGLYGGNVTAGPAKMFFDTATKVSDTLRAKDTAEAEQRRSASKFGLELDTIKNYESVLSAMKPKTLTEEEIQKKITEEGPDAVKNLKQELSPLDKIELREIFIDLNPELDTDEGRAALDSKPVEMLYGDALKSLRRQRRALTSASKVTSTTPSGAPTSPRSAFDK